MSLAGRVRVMTDDFGQGAYSVRMEWGPIGAQACAADVSLVVDVLSFSTSVTIATERGMHVFPCPWKDSRAYAFAEQHDAVLAVGRLEASRLDGAILPSLSPARLLEATPVPRLVLPSPNGSAITSVLRDSGSVVAIGCLRNARVASTWAAEQIAAGRTVAIIAAGERWDADDSLRPCMEDQLGAGAIASHLLAAGHTLSFSPEAIASARLFDAMAADLAEVLHDCVGGRELTARGFLADVEAASALDASSTVPILRDGAFTR